MNPEIINNQKKKQRISVYGSVARMERIKTMSRMMNEEKGSARNISHCTRRVLIN
jgi:hypothetical protein